MYDAVTVADYIVEKSNLDGNPVSNLKLQKILYFVQAQFLVSRDEACFPESIEAWDFGPVVPIVYRKYKAFGSASIPFIGNSVIRKITETDRSIIDMIVDACVKYTASQLVTITHNQAPWKNVYTPYKNNIITKRSIKEFYATA